MRSISLTCLAAILLLHTKYCESEQVRFGDYPDTRVEPSSFEKSLKPAPADKRKPAKPKKKRVLRVGLLGDPRQIEFRGVKAFEVDDLRQALARDVTYQAAARSSAPLVDLLARLEERIEQGYRYAGIRSEVSATLGGPGIVVTVDERNQPKRFARFVVDEGGPEEFIRRLVLERIERDWTYVLAGHERISGTTQSMFLAGEPVQGDEKSTEQFTRHLVACLLDTGRVVDSRSLDLDAETNADGMVEQRVRVVDNEPRLRIGEIEINGLTRHSREEILDLIGVAEGDPLRAEALEQLCDRLAGCHRFWQHWVRVHVPPRLNRYDQEALDAKIQIDLTEFEAVPKLGEPLSETDQAILRVAGWLSRFDQFEKDLVAEIRGEHGWGKAVVSPRADSALFEFTGDLEFGEVATLSLDHCFVARPDDWLLVDRRRGERLHAKIPRKPFFSLACRTIARSPLAQYAGKLTIGLSWQADPAGKSWAIDINPMALLRTARGRGTARLDDGQLVIEESKEVVRFDAETGELVGVEGCEVLGLSVNATVEPGAYERRLAEIEQSSQPLYERYDAERPQESAVLFVLDQLGHQPMLTEHPLAPLALSAVRAVLAETEFAALLDQSEAEFRIPKPITAERDRKRGCQTSKMIDDWWRYGVGRLPAVADASFPRGSWAWTAVREYGLLAELRYHEKWDASASSLEMAQLVRKEKIGPLASLMFASWMAANQNGKRGAGYFAEHGLKQIDNEEAVIRDLAPLSEGNLLGGRMIEVMVRHASTLSAEQKQLLLESLPDVLKEPMSTLLERRDAQPDETPLLTVREATLDAWRGGWRDEVAAELRRLAEE